MQQPVQIVPAVQSPGSGPGSVQNVLQANTNNLAVRDDRWSEAIAVGSLAFVETVKNDLGVKARHREVIQAGGVYALREPAEAYAGKFTGKNEVLRAENTFFWDETVENAPT
jgi:hypothetical protein